MRKIIFCLFFILILFAWSQVSAFHDGIYGPRVPAQLMEVEYPIRLEQYALTKDSGGPGQYRGGLALTREWRYLGTQPANLTIRSDRKEHPPYGLYGGCPGAISTNIINPEPNLKNNRFNDGKCDNQGRFYAGTMNDINNEPTVSFYIPVSYTHLTLPTKS